MLSPTNTPPMIFSARMAMADIPGCEKQREKVLAACDPPEEKAKCKDNTKVANAKDKLNEARQKAKEELKKTGGNEDHFYKDPGYNSALNEWNSEMDAFAKEVTEDDCQQAMRCLLSPYDPSKCCPGQTPHHLVEASSFFDTGRVGGAWKGPKSKDLSYQGRHLIGCEKYKTNDAPCICVEGENQHQATHGLMHTAQNELTSQAPNSPVAFASSMPVSDDCQRLETAQKNAAKAINTVFKDKGCDEACIEAQLKNYHETKCGMEPGRSIRKVMA